MTSEEYIKITNKDGQIKLLPVPKSDEISKVKYLLRSIDAFMLSIIHKKHRDGLISKEDYTKILHHNFCYIDSIFTRIRIFSLLREDIYYIVRDVIKDNEENEGFMIPNSNSLRLVSLYKEYLDNIYNIMENISRFNLFFFNKNMAHSFSDQCKKIIDGKYDIPPEYIKIIENEMDWYRDVHLIRSNMNHFLIGDYEIKKTDNGEWIFKYENVNLSSRMSHTEISYIERNILNDVEEFYMFLFQFLKKIFLVYLKQTGPKSKGHFLKYTEDGICIHELSFYEYISGEKGEIIEKFD
ncbi:hypothetical protein [Methanosarcina sp. WH1]|uniref:hypothetical protein n=1 Tax=Methanosarcina sp. WH1 TaxID=1434102 RepID=UPI0006161E3D|nr:hypothetical protein [Methanosarcina sp. WH1]AKB21874.1 hypothetical protein MSWH1_1603 [Methanosarcina sp. WH1]